MKIVYTIGCKALIGISTYR